MGEGSTEACLREQRGRRELGRRVLSYYDQIADGYDATRRADPFLVSSLSRHLGIEPQGRYLDVGCGTGNYTVALAKQGGVWHGVDCSLAMLDAARRKNPSVRWQIAQAARLPFCGYTFSGVICTLAIHNFGDLTAPFQSIHRVMAEGPFVILTSTSEQVSRYWLHEYFPLALRNVVDQMHRHDSIYAALGTAGFERVESEPYDIREDLQDLFLYSGKNRPVLYLDATVRARISGLSRWADAAEIEKGCHRLESDIRSGRIDEVRKKFEHDGGDYLFMIAHKS